MRIEVKLPLAVKRLVMGQISSYDPRTSGSRMDIAIPPPKMALLDGERMADVEVRRLALKWALELDPENGKRFWKVTPVGCEDLIRNLEMELTHDFDDPLDVR